MKIDKRKKKIFIFLFIVSLGIGAVLWMVWQEGIFLQIKESFPDDFIIEEENIEWQDADYSTIMQKGEASTGLTHINADGKEFIKKIEEYMKKNFPKIDPSVETMDNSISVNKQTGEILTYYENYTYWYPDSTKGNYENYFYVCRDTVSDKLVDVLAYHQDKKVCENFILYTIECIYGKLSEEDNKKIHEILNSYTIEDNGNKNFRDITISMIYDGEKYEYNLYKER